MQHQCHPTQAINPAHAASNQTIQVHDAADHRQLIPRSGLGKVHEFGQAATLVKRHRLWLPALRRECAWRNLT